MQMENNQHDESVFSSESDHDSDEEFASAESRDSGESSESDDEDMETFLRSVKRREQALKNMNSLKVLTDSGRPPTNFQLVTALDRAAHKLKKTEIALGENVVTESELPESSTTSTASTASVRDSRQRRTKQALEDGVDLLKASTVILEKKNDEESLQQLLLNLVFMVEKSRKKNKTKKESGVSSSSNPRKENFAHLVAAARDLALLSVRSHEFRRFIFDVALLVDDLLEVAKAHRLSQGPNSNGLQPSRSHENITASTLSTPEYTPDPTPEPTPRETDSTSPLVSPKEKKSNILDFKKTNIAKKFPALLQKLSQHEPWQRVVDYATIALGDFIAVAADQLGTNADEDTTKIKTEVKKIIEKFTGGKSIDPMMAHLEAAVTAVRSDPQAKLFLKDLRGHMEKCFKSPEVLKDDGFIFEGLELVDRAKGLAKTEGGSHLRRALREWKKLKKIMKKDPELVSFNNATKKLAKDLTFVDEKGRIRLDDNVLSNIKDLVLPSIIEKLEYIPIPKLESDSKNSDGSEPEIHWSAEKIVFNVFEVLPENVEIETHTKTTFNMKKMVETARKKTVERAAALTSTSSSSSSRRSKSLTAESESTSRTSSASAMKSSSKSDHKNDKKDKKEQKKAEKEKKKAEKKLKKSGKATTRSRSVSESVAGSAMDSDSSSSDSDTAPDGSDVVVETKTEESVASPSTTAKSKTTRGRASSAAPVPTLVISPPIDDGADPRPLLHSAREQKPQMRTRGSIILHLSDLNATITDVVVNFKRNKFPQISDSGSADILIRGADVKVILLLDTVDAQYPTFSADKAQVYVRKLKLKLRGTKHDSFYNWALKMLRKRIKQSVRTAIRETLSSYTATLATQINSIIATFPPIAKKLVSMPHGGPLTGRSENSSS